MRNFVKVIEKANIACENSGVLLSGHFADLIVGIDATRNLPEIALTRFACCLIAQNGDAQKDPVASAQTYFAVQNRKSLKKYCWKEM